MKLSKYPNQSAYFRRTVLNKYIEHGGNVEFALALADKFLSKYPYYPEALLFKARMLIALGKNKKALTVLKAIKKIDEWKIEYTYDQAEVLFNLGQKKEAAKILKSTIELSLRNISEGTENFLRGIDFCSDEMKNIQKMIMKEIIINLSKDKYELDFKKIIKALSTHKPSL
jgi:tetratricopeptide (TPR) repeat protein